MYLPKIVTPDEWLAERKELLAREKDFTRQRDALSEARRQLPMVKVEKEYVFEGPNGSVSLRDLFEGHRQLIVYHFMFDPSWSEGCKSCSYVMDNVAGGIVHLAARDTSFVVISRAPLATIEPFKERMGWTFPWFSSFANDFNYDFHVTLDPEKGDYVYNYTNVAALIKAGKNFTEKHPDGASKPKKGELPGLSVFLHDADSIYHTYSTYGRGLDLFLNTYNLLDMTPLGRQEERSKGMVWVRHHDKYAPQVSAGQCHC
jgi:predicted dithiol-disulfide oxidoreductase (DUF899 family)